MMNFKSGPVYRISGKTRRAAEKLRAAAPGTADTTNLYCEAVMKIKDILTSGKINVSCELFPPKLGRPLGGARRMVREVAQLNPAFISVTCGAGGSTGDNTLEIAKTAQEAGSAALAHLTCVSLGRNELFEKLTALRSAGIENILALRGDIPEGFDPSVCEFRHASDLARAIGEFGGFCVGGACYPEGHPESASLEADIDALKIKAEAGCSFFTTQMFFDNAILYNFMYRLLKKGVDVPVVAGIMPVTHASQIDRIFSMTGTAIPRRFRMMVDRFGDDPAAMCQAGVAYATEQIIDLIANGVTNIHIYTMNHPDVAGSIMRNLSEIIAK